MMKTVFFGGTFNPPHNAHKIMLSVANNLQNVEKILVVPTNIPPHKTVEGYCASFDDRFEMCNLLCNSFNKAQVSDIEFKRQGKSYTFDTVNILKKEYENIAILIGGDMMSTFDTWYNYKELIKMVEILAVRRKGVPDAEFDDMVQRLIAEGAKITVLDVDLPEISSTEIRECFETQNVEKLHSLLPENVMQYISENGLYRE
jgi:nicotinate-nucleotide adenylyltransferase